MPVLTPWEYQSQFKKTCLINNAISFQRVQINDNYLALQYVSHEALGPVVIKLHGLDRSIT